MLVALSKHYFSPLRILEVAGFLGEPYLEVAVACLEASSLVVASYQEAPSQVEGHVPQEAPCQEEQPPVHMRQVPQ